MLLFYSIKQRVVIILGDSKELVINSYLILPRRILYFLSIILYRKKIIIYTYIRLQKKHTVIMCNFVKLFEMNKLKNYFIVKNCII